MKLLCLYMNGFLGNLVVLRLGQSTVNVLDKKLLLCVGRPVCLVS